MKKQNVRTLSLIVCTFTYLLVGAAVFDALESEEEGKNKQYLQDQEDEFKRRHNVSEDQYLNLTRIVYRSRPHKAGPQWKFPGAFYFATTVITTIGYGHSTPKTIEGKIFCMLYAFMGIPLNLVMFQSVGERLNTFITFLLKNLKRCLKLKNTEVSQTNLILIGLNMSSMVLFGGAFAFSEYEQWNFIDSVYYCFITLTTIGFGDYVPLQQNGVLTGNPQYVAFSLLFILFGLTVVSGAMNLLVLRFLTMNTEDERKQEQEAALAARTAVRLEGDVITANGSVISGQQEQLVDNMAEFSDLTSVCSCSCYNFRQRGKHRFTVTRSPGKISHLLPLQPMDSIGPSSGPLRADLYATSYTDETTSLVGDYPSLRHKRASI